MIVDGFAVVCARSRKYLCSLLMLVVVVVW